MTAIAPYRSELETGHDGFAQLLRAEWTKFRTVRGWVIGTLVGALLIVGLGVLTGANSICSSQPDPNGPSTACPAPPTGPGGEWVNDSLYFVRQPLAGNGSLTVRVTSLTGLYSTHGQAAGAAGASPTAGMTPGVQPWSKAGIIIRASTAQGSAYAAMMVTGTHGVRMQWDFTGDTAGLAGKVSATSPRWLRLTRAGDVISGYDSADGAHWTLVGTVTLAELPATAQAGLFAASPGYSVTSSSLGGSSTQGRSRPGHRRLRPREPGRVPGPPPGGPARTSGGSTDMALAPSAQGFTQAGDRLTVSGSGDIAPAAGDGPNAIQQALSGTFAGLITLVVIGVMFITAEYRRGLIRTTLAASPRRGRVLAAKAVVLAGVTFVTGLVAVAVVIPVGEHLLHENGNPIYPLPALTEVRIVAGTAALLAVAAVLALAVGTLLRNSAGAITAVVAGIVLPYLLAVLPGVLPAGAGQWLVRVTPAAAFAVQQYNPQYAQVTASYSPASGYFPLAPWAGFAVLCAWAVLAFGLAIVLLRRRDV